MGFKAITQPVSTTIAVGGRSLPNDMWLHTLTFLDAFDLLALARCSKASRLAATSPLVIHALFSRPAYHAEREEFTVDFSRSLLVLVFMARNDGNFLGFLLAGVRRLTAACDLMASTMFQLFLAQLKLARVTTLATPCACLEHSQRLR